MAIRRRLRALLADLDGRRHFRIGRAAAATIHRTEHRHARSDSRHHEFRRLRIRTVLQRDFRCVKRHHALAFRQAHAMDCGRWSDYGSRLCARLLQCAVGGYCGRMVHCADRRQHDDRSGCGSAVRPHSGNVRGTFSAFYGGAQIVGSSAGTFLGSKFIETWAPDLRSVRHCSQSPVS